MSRNRITGGDGFWIVLIGFFSAIAYPKAFVAIIVIAAIIFTAVIISQYANLPICQSCGKKTKLVFLRRRVDGGPDRRYNHNPLVCQYCYTDPNTFTKIINKNDTEKNVVSCHYVNQPGMRKFEDCPDYPKNIGEKCKKCWVKNQ